MNEKKKPLELEKKLSISDVRDVAQGEKELRLSNKVLEKIERGRKAFEALVKEGKKIYGVNTGLGALQDAGRSDEGANIGKRILRSHAAGVGEPMDKHIVRGAMTLLANSLASGHSGIRKKVVELLVKLLNDDVYPYVPQKGSVGASGDLAPAAHVALTLIGEGEIIHNGTRKESQHVLRNKGLSPIDPDPREALGLLNGTYFMTSFSIFNILQSQNLLKTAESITALTFEALRGHKSHLHPQLHELRPHPGQLQSVDHLNALLEGSNLLGSDKGDLQDAYSLRCAPQVLGSARDALSYARDVIEREVNAITDNPLIFWKDGEKVISGGNFHGAPLAISQETLGTAVASIGNISERRIARLLDEKLSDLSPFLVENAGENTGLMLSQYTAAALVAENKVFTHPSNVDSIPTSANQEDYNNFGIISAQKTKQVIENVAKIIGIEAICAAQAIDLIGGTEKLGRGTRKTYHVIREEIPFIKEDKRAVYKLLKNAEKLVRSGKLAEFGNEWNPER